jgi:hypothetical protein
MFRRYLKNPSKSPKRVLISKLLATLETDVPQVFEKSLQKPQEGAHKQASGNLRN